MKYTKVINGKLLKIKHTKYNNASSLFDKSPQGRGVRGMRSGGSPPLAQFIILLIRQYE
jgi:hypothetical protein